MLAQAGAVESTQIRTDTHDCATEPLRPETLRLFGEFFVVRWGLEGGTARLREAGVVDMNMDVV
jgi:hypothetical protein